jgi:hypothetical protein
MEWPQWSVDIMQTFLAKEPTAEARCEVGIAQSSALYIGGKLPKGKQGKSNSKHDAGIQRELRRYADLVYRLELVDALLLRLSRMTEMHLERFFPEHLNQRQFMAVL